MIEPIVDQVRKLVLEVREQCAGREDVKKSCDTCCHCDDDEHYNKLVTCLFLLHDGHLCSKNCHVEL